MLAFDFKLIFFFIIYYFEKKNLFYFVVSRILGHKAFMDIIAPSRLKTIARNLFLPEPPPIVATLPTTELYSNFIEHTRQSKYFSLFDLDIENYVLETSSSDSDKDSIKKKKRSLIILIERRFILK